MTETSTDLVVPGVGEVVSLDDGAQCARAIDAIRDLEYQLRMVKTELTRALVAQSEQEGSKTLRYEGVEVTVKGGVKVEYDADAMYLDLLAAGMSEQRAGDVVVEVVTRKVNAVEAKRVAAANPAYAEVVERHRSEVDVPYSVSMSVKS